jgi:serine phosphatase RsbU (regulator of sigma subunit)
MNRNSLKEPSAKPAKKIEPDPYQDLYSNAYRLRFSPSTEKAFMDQYYPRKVAYARFAIIVGMVLYLLNIYTDFIMFPQHRDLSLIIRLCGSLLALGLLCITFTSFFRKWHEAFLFMISIGATGGVVIFTYLGSGLPPLLYHSGVMLCMVFLFAFIRIRFFLATLSGWMLVILYIVPHALLEDMGRTELMHNSMNLGGIVIVGMAIAYMNEYAARYSFVQSLVIEDNNRALTERNARMEIDLELARGIQDQYLAGVSPTPHCCVHYVSMDKVGGDFYEFITFPEKDRIGIFLSDVAGHGVPAALIASMLKITIASSRALHDDPGALMAHINDVMCGKVNSNFITAMYCIIDHTERRMDYSMAGHNPPFIIEGSGTRSLPSMKTLPLGLFPSKTLAVMGKPYATASAALQPGGKVLLYTDGLTEARELAGSGRFFEYGGMHDEITRLATLSCGDFVRELFDALVRFRGNDSFDDDICMICADIS